MYEDVRVWVWAGTTPTTPSRAPGAAASAGGIPTRATDASAFSGCWARRNDGLAYIANSIDAPPADKPQPSYKLTVTYQASQEMRP